MPPQLFIHDAARVTEISLDDDSMAGRRTGALVKAVDRRRRQGGAAEHAPGQLLLRGSATVSLDAGVQRAARAERNATCPKDLGTTACHSTHSTCQAITSSAKGPTYTTTAYTCRCDDGYQGNAYLSDGCQGTLTKS
jgi:hypothetical protein